MLEEPNHIDDLFNDFLHNYEENVPSYMWSNLRDELKARKRLRVLHRLRVIAASVALLISFGLGYYFSNLEAINKTVNSPENSHIRFWQAETNTIGDSLDLKEEQTIKKQSDNQRHKKNISYNTLQNKQSSDADDSTENLFRKYKYLLALFMQDSEDSKKEDQLAKKSQKANQLLTDTLLLRKESLRTEGFPSTKKKNKASAWSFGTKFSPVFAVEESSAAIADANGTKSQTNNGIQDIAPEEKPVTSFSGGINVNYQLNERVSVESGIFYLNKKQSTENLIASKNTEFGNSDYTVYTPEQSINMQDIGAADRMKQNYSTVYYNMDASYTANAEYIELPLIIRYKLINQKLGLDVMSGISTNFLVNNNSYIVSGENKLWSNNPDLNSIYYGASLGLGINYQFYQNFSFNLEPTFKYSFLSENSIFRKYPYSFAVFAGFSYRFK